MHTKKKKEKEKNTFLLFLKSFLAIARSNIRKSLLSCRSCLFDYFVSLFFWKQYYLYYDDCLYYFPFYPFSFGCCCCCCCCCCCFEQKKVYDCYYWKGCCYISIDGKKQTKNEERLLALLRLFCPRLATCFNDNINKS